MESLVKMCKKNVFICLLLLSNSFLFSQEFKLVQDESKIKISGTSTVHDWEEKVEKQTIVLRVSNLEKMTIESLTAEIQAESIKSGKSSMDQNTYKALKTDSYKTITFKMTKLNKVSKVMDNKFEATITGTLNIAGSTKSIELPMLIETDWNTITLTGKKQLKMTDFNIDPPKALMGTIKTGDEITVEFNCVLAN